MKKALFAVFVLLVACSVVECEMLSGGEWKKYAYSDKVSFINGFCAGLNSCQSVLMGKLSTPPKWLAYFPFPSGVTAGQTVAILDQFYEDYKNISIPVQFALLIIKKEMDGASEDEITRLKQAARKLVAEHQE